MTDAPAQTKDVPHAGGLGIGAGLLLLAVLTVLWGVNWPMMKLAVAEVPVWTFRSICLLGAGAGFVLICRFAGQSFRIPRGQIRQLLVVSLFNVTIWHICSATGLVHLAASRAAIIAFTMPLWAAVLAVPVLGERPTLYTIGGLAEIVSVGRDTWIRALPINDRKLNVTVGVAPRERDDVAYACNRRVMTTSDGESTSARISG